MVMGEYSANHTTVEDLQPAVNPWRKRSEERMNLENREATSSSQEEAAETGVTTFTPRSGLF